MLKSTAGSAAGLAGVSQTAIAWAQPTESELSELERDPNVQAVISELGLNTLPDGMRKASNSVGEGKNATDFELWEGEVEYGTLHVGRIGDLTNVVFEFAEDFQLTAPRRFRSIPKGTEPLISAEEGKAFVRRSATEREEAAISRLIPTSGSKVAYTATNVSGFQVDFVRYDEESEELNQQRFSIDVGGDGDEEATGGRRRHGRTDDKPHPVFQESSRALEEASERTVQAQNILENPIEPVQDVVKGVQSGYFKWDGDLGDAKWHLENTHKPWKKLPDDVKKLDNLTKGSIKSIVLAEAAEEGAEHLFGECGEPCSDCAMTASDILLNCHKCRIFLGAGISSTGPAGLVLFVVCVWSFCNFPGAINKCSTCVDCYTKE